jgi:hypothetical protein
VKIMLELRVVMVLQEIRVKIVVRIKKN